MIRMSLDVQAIQKLMKDDPEFVIDIKKGIVANLTEKSIKPLLNIEEIKDAIFEQEIANKRAMELWSDAIKEEIQKQIGSVKERTSWGKKSNTITLNKESKAAVEYAAANIVREQLNEIITAAAKRALEDKLDHINILIEKRLTENINAIVDKEVKRRLEAAKNV